MQINSFWKSWLIEYRRLWYALGAVSLFFLIFLWTEKFTGVDNVIEWVKLQEQKPVETIVHTFHLGPFNLSIPAESLVILEYLQGSSIAPNTTASYIFLLGLTLGVSVLLSAITTFKRYWYFGGMALFILFLASLRLEVIGLFGLYNKVPPAIVMGLFVALSFYFNRFSSDISFSYRLISFLMLDIVVALLIAFAASVEYPFYHLTLTGYATGMIVTILFTILIAHEIIAAFITMVSRTTHSLRHFTIIAGIYMVNIMITCFHELGYLHWNFLYLDLYLLLTCSTILGIWGFRQRESQYAYIFPFAPTGAFIYLALAIICFATTGQLLGNSNDPALKVIRDAVIFSHTGYSVIFLVYIFSNFIFLLARNLPVHKVLYNPTRMPYFTYRFAGIIAMLGFVFYSGWRDYIFHSMAGFYNTTGDLYTLLGNDVYAESFYEQAALQAFRNNRSNYALATMKASRFNFDDAHRDYKLSNAIRPTAYSLVNSGNLYIWEDRIQDAIQTYRDGYTTFRSPGPLDNNLGFAYTKLHQLDSAVLYLNNARKHSLTKASAEINFFALSTFESLPLKIDSTLEVFDTNSDAVLANALALSTLQKRNLKTAIQPLKPGKLNLFTATLLNNYLIKHATSVDTGFVSKAYSVAADSLNYDFSESLKSSVAFAYYHRGNVSRALEIMGELAFVTQSDKGKYNYIMGLWALEQGNPELASTYFTYADTYDYKDARFYNAIALSEAGKVSQATTAWDSVAFHQRGELQAIAIQMNKILTLPLSAVTSINDAEKYQYCRYKVGLRDSVNMDLVLNGIEDPNYKARAILDVSRRYYESDMINPAVRYFSRIGGLELTDKDLYEEIRQFELLMLATQRDLKGLAEQINGGIIFSDANGLEKQLYTALMAELSGDTVKAKSNYEVLATYNPYLEEGIIAAAQYFKRHDNNRLRSYSILAEAIQINANSIRLLKAYISEATRIGFDEYATDASKSLRALQEALR